MVEVLAIIPARGGSKGIPLKNIKSLGGHPLIAYSIAAGLRAEQVNRVIVSTDDNEIADRAKDYGAEVPFLRPSEYARDETRDLPVFLHALDWFSKHEGYQPDLVIQLRPTSPFRPVHLLDEVIKVIQENPKATSVRGVVPSKQNPYKMWKIEKDGRMDPILDTEIAEPYNMLRQELPETYWQTGHIDVTKRETILNGSMSGNVIFPYIIDPIYSIDLDNQLDWDRAENRLKNLRSQIILPAGDQALIPGNVSLLVLDFDGVLTDDRVYVNEQGEESVAAHRGDGMGISRLKKNGIEVIILSRETNPVVKARGDKLGVPVYQGVVEKGHLLSTIIKDKKVSPDQVVYLGNDINDLPCFPLVGLSVAVADAHPDLKKEAQMILTKNGGFGAVRELCDLILESIKR